MDSTKIQKEIQEYEAAGLDVVATHNGKLTHVTGGVNQSSDVCDSCTCLSFEPDPDPHDWFRDGDRKAVCTEAKATIEGALERPSEMVNIRKPIWCPKSQNILTEEQKEDALKDLERAQNRYKNS